MKSFSKLQARLGHLKQRMLRHKDFGEHCMKTELRRCLTTPQLTLLGIGNTIGVGIYVMLGVMAKENAGPSVVLSFMAAIFVTMMNALVFAEFATFVPQTGACYVYIYRVLGEFLAFLVGWVMLITFALSSSVGARAWSGMVDSFFNHTIQEKTNEIFGKIQFGLPFAESLDILAFVFQIIVVCIISCNVFCSSIINTILGIITSSVLIFVFIAGFIYGDVHNFTNAAHGGFMPFGLAGVVKGASMAIYATSGFEIVSLSAEEAKDPAKSVPRAIILELLLVGTIYIGAAIGMLYLIPYYLIDLRAPLPSAFDYNGVTWGKFIVTIGPLFGITNLQMLGLYGLSRILYRMAKDGLFFQWFLKVNKRTGIPLNSVLFVGAITSVSALLFDLSYIVKVTVLLMLLNYMVVGSALIKLKITECNKMKLIQTVEKPTADEAQSKLLESFYDHEVVVSEYETCESAESPEVEAAEPEDPGSKVDEVLIDFTSDPDVKGDILATTFDSSEEAAASRGEKYLPEANAKKNILIDSNSKPDKGTAVKDRNSVSEKSQAPHSAGSSREDLVSTDGSPASTAAAVSKQMPLWKQGNSTNISNNCNDNDSDDQQTLFQKTCGISSNKNNALRESDNQKRTSSATATPGEVTQSCKNRCAKFMAPFVPGVISVNTLLAFHWICCVVISYQLNFGWQDLTAVKPLAISSLAALASLLVIFSFLLWTQCGATAVTGFQTPLMPLVPTASILSSSALLLSGGELVGFMEVIIIVSIGAVVYIIMVLVGYESELQVPHSEDCEQRKALVGGSGDDADDEVDSEDEL
ncbi:unnamed protein product [Candidula unifasciata]|uniref:Uncharacterized protein n=1 Tax=Candidula unifasciata TaxID=100452 RepID=A0A8S3Z866_9EUPU|nr:unnamed protein product [Candidula unifasciata]